MTDENLPKIASKENRQARAPSSFQEQLVRQLRYLDNSSRLFDNGDHHEANRLATTIRVLLHEVPNKADSHSLLGLLGIREKILYVDTGLYRARLNAVLEEDARAHGTRIGAHQPGECGLVECRPISGGEFGWAAPLTDQRFGHPNDPRERAMRGPQSFKNWWNDPLVESSTMRTFSRRHLITIMANQDGGAHVDPTVDKDYVLLCVDHLGVAMQHGDNLPDLTMSTTHTPPNVRNNVAAASVRQIAFELALSIHRYLDDHPDVLGDVQRSPMYRPLLVPRFDRPMLRILTTDSSNSGVGDEVLKVRENVKQQDPMKTIHEQLKSGYSWNRKRNSSQ